MRPLLRLALGATAALAVTRLADRSLPRLAFAEAPGAPLLAAAPLRPPCPPGALPDHGACIPVPSGPIEDGPAPDVAENAHHDRSGRLVRYEHIPRRPERPSDYRKYRLPIPIPGAQSFARSGYDLDLPDAEQRRGASLKAVGHGGIDLAAPRGTRVQAVRLEHQLGDAEVLFAGELFGTTVVTRHSVSEAGAPRDYLVLHGHLERAAALRPGDAAPLGTVLGFVGDTGSPGAVHLHLEVRRVRDDVKVRELAPLDLVNNARTIACDPRNMLEFSDAPP